MIFRYGMYVVMMLRCGIHVVMMLRCGIYAVMIIRPESTYDFPSHNNRNFQESLCCARSLHLIIFGIPGWKLRVQCRLWPPRVLYAHHWCPWSQVHNRSRQSLQADHPVIQSGYDSKFEGRNKFVVYRWIKPNKQWVLARVISRVWHFSARTAWSSVRPNV
jgi:hypothetical protein